MLNSVQRWLGGKAMIDVPGFVVAIIGVRHTLWGEATPEDSLGIHDCPIVHRSWDAWFECSQRNISACQVRMLDRMYGNLGANFPERLLAESKMASARLEARIMANSLRS